CVSPGAPVIKKETVIGRNVYLGAGAIILPGVTIGDNSIIGAGAVVTKDIPSNCVAMGVPAKVAYTLDEWIRKKGQFR
ncbi:MAG TPA: DapH/DapD/GlmU-related protein, partial [Candidatus Methanoperedens sp.]